ncbi:DUF3352 domain-containing protein [Desulfofustis glycolicus]|uniref:DUF3352 domain-containing protein n=1 Tax=Desulfofustis glycolicus DSM 9705 TaxID=1121409 RepID=A0A1M5U8T6_9BACT|nr:DUF3352 domain-containing protein [Desulfofustis glycolicus]MCB2214588.1 DUF3352 domain-containing protein [Desulfobulbaceae bacterium]SHH59328.1 Protein of unknown function [Desulfofustis glycolicus DSM 9705]
MRQLIFVIPLFLLLLFLVSLFPPDFTKRIDPERFLDPDTLLLINQKQLARRIDDFASSRLGSVLHSIDAVGIAADLEMPAARIAQIDEGQKALGRAADDPIIRSVLGRNMSVALLPFDYDGAVPLTQQILANLVLICRPKQAVHMQELLERFSGGAPPADSPYGAYAIRRYLTDGGMSIVTVRVDRAVLLSTNERLLRRCLDNYDRYTDTLAADPAYRNTKKMFPGTAIYGYLNVAGFTDLLARAVTVFAASKDSEPSVEDRRHSLYQHAFFGSWIGDGTVSQKAVLTFDPARIPAELSSIFSAPPEVTHSADHLTAGTLWYYWTNSYAPDSILELIRRQQRQHRAASPIDTLLRELEVATGTGVEQIVEFFANDLILALKKGPKDDLLPIPLFLVAIKCKNTPSVKELVERIIVHYSLPIRRKKIGDHTIVSWGEVAPISSFEPSVATVDDYLLIANNVEQIKEFITPPEGNERLSESPLFNLVNKGFLYTNNSLVFLNMAELSGQLKEIVSWGGLVLALKDRTIADKSKIIIDRLINPLLDGVAMYGVIGTRKYLRDEQVIMEATAVIDDGK